MGQMGLSEDYMLLEEKESIKATEHQQTQMQNMKRRTFGVPTMFPPPSTPDLNSRLPKRYLGCFQTENAGKTDPCQPVGTS